MTSNKDLRGQQSMMTNSKDTIKQQLDDKQQRPKRKTNHNAIQEDNSVMTGRKDPSRQQHVDKQQN